MSTRRDHGSQAADPTRWVAGLSIALVFFTLPHALEDFALGEPQARGIPAPAIATVVSILFAAQAAGLYWLGRGLARGLWAHVALGVIWPVASGLAQLPEIFGEEPYRSGALSMAYVFGIILVGASLLVASLLALRGRAERARGARPDAG